MSVVLMAITMRGRAKLITLPEMAGSTALSVMKIEEYEEIEKIIQSAVSRVVHEQPSKQTLVMMEEMNKSRMKIAQETRDLTGKIDTLMELVEKHNVRHEADMEDIRPIIKEYKERVIRDAFLKDVGEKTKWIAGVGIALATIWLFIKGIWRPWNQEHSQHEKTTETTTC